VCNGRVVRGVRYGLMAEGSGDTRARMAGLARGVEVDALIGLAIDASPVGMMVVDDRGIILFANREAERAFGSAESELVGQAVEQLIPRDLGSRHAALREAYLRNPEARQMGSGRHLLARRRDGSEFPVEVGLNPVHIDSRAFVLASIVDISERRDAESATRRAVEERLSFEAIVTEISAKFVNLPAEALDDAITDALRQIVDALDLDRAVVWLREDDDFYPAQRWAREGVPLTAERLSVRRLFPWSWTQIMAGKVATYSRVSDIPDEATRASVIRFGAIAGATVGFSIGGAVAGCVAFATTRQERQWPEAEMSRLQLLSRVFAGAIARQRSDKALAAALSQVQRLSERLKDENAYLRSEVEQVRGGSPIVGQSAPILQALDLVAQVAPTDSSVLLLGETGTGKELFATQVHELSSRRHRLMVRVNCAAIPATLLESELFGREKGAYTGALTRQTGRFELADKSTIFLDEIGDLPIEVQVKLLRVLEDRQVERLGSSRATHVDVRIVAATHRNLEEMVAAGTFREDLYYRLNVFPVRIPPLRERPADIPLLVWRFMDEFSKRFGKTLTGIDKDCMTELQRHPWPGNVRELRNVVERAMIVARPGGRLVIPVVPTAFAAAQPKSSKLIDVETAHLRSILESCAWRIRGAGGAAERLGLKPSTLETRLAKLGLRRPTRPDAPQ
jgi:formate hydrogenlyase transcriptional activator